MTPSVSLGGALVAAVTVTVAYRLLLGMLPRTAAWARTAAVLITLILGARYVTWRVSWTLPPLTASFDALWPWAFFAVETLVLASAAVTLITITRHADRSPEADAGESRLARAGRLPEVDVLIPTYNENETILEKTIVGAVNLDWPSFEVFVLDDGRRPWLERLCARKGATYVIRDEHRHAKAGNLNNGLRVSSAPFVMVLDADFVPRRNFLRRVMGLFDDPAVGIVQTPQHFYNADPVQYNLVASRAWADEQRFFFDTLQPAKDAWDCAFCCGTSSVVRRAALDKVGGFPTATVTEDIHLTYRLFDHGYITRYLGENLSMGLAAEGVSEYLSQRARWCIGTFQQLFLRSGPLGWNRQTPMQRLQFMLGIFHWLLFPHRILFMVAPAVYWFTDVAAIHTEFAPLLYFFLPAYLANWMLITWLARNTIFPVFWDVSQYLAAFVILRSTAAALVHPFGHAFKVTAKGGDRTRVVVHWSIVWKAAALLAVIAFGMAINVGPATSIVSLEGRTVNVAWSVFNMVVLGFVVLAAIDLPRPRKEERFSVDETAALDDRRRTPRPARLIDVSLSGARLRVDGAAPPACDIDIGEVGRVPAALVAQTGDEATYRFADPEGAARDRLIVKLFAGAYQNTVAQSSSRALLAAAFRRAFG